MNTQASEYASDMAAKHTALRATRDAFAKKLTEALTAAGFSVTSTMPAKDWASALVTIKSDKTNEFENSATFEIRGEGFSRWLPTKIVLVYSTTAGFTRSRMRYHKIDDKLITKLVDMAQKSLENVIRSTEYRNEQAQLDAHYAAVKKEQLAGVVIPPGTKVRINASKDDTYAGKYFINFERYSSAITGKPLTAEQVKKLLAVLNEIQGTANGWAIVGKDACTGARVIRGELGFFANDTDAKLYPTREAAEKDFEFCSSLFGSRGSLEIVPYASLMTI